MHQVWKKTTGVITNHYATLPGLQQVHDGDSHKEEIPAQSIQFVTTNNASSNCSCSRPHEWFLYFSEKHEVSSLKCIGFAGRLSRTRPIIIPLQPIALGATSEVHWFYGPLVYYSRLYWNERHQSLEIPPTSEATNKKLQYYCWLRYVITISQQRHTHDLPRNRW